MKQTEQQNRFRALDDWFGSDQGRHVSEAFAHALQPISDQFSGHVMLQLGNCADNLWWKNLRYNHQFIATPTSIKSNKIITTIANSL